MKSAFNVSDSVGEAIWPDSVPGSLGENIADRPTLYSFPLHGTTPNSASMLILPGGGYRQHSPSEGRSYADWFTARGIEAHVLNYRLAVHGYGYPQMAQDVARALRIVRHRARVRRLPTDKIGIMGSSAGGHLAAMLLVADTSRDPVGDAISEESARPDLGVLCYPLISFVNHPNQACSDRLLPNQASFDAKRALSAELFVTKETPPCFLWHCADDPAVSPLHSVLFASALLHCAGKCEVHLYEKGGHGMGLGTPDFPAPAWSTQLETWLRSRDWIHR